MGSIRVNQMGYTPNSQKKIVVVGEGTQFRIFDAKSDTQVFEGELGERIVDEASGDAVRSGDFSDFNQPGDYYLQVAHEKSVVFTIHQQQPEICTDALLKAFYYQRCGCALTETHAGDWKHDVCHVQPTYIFHQEAEKLLVSNPELLEKIDVTGGWHDAGDYGRYTVAAAKAIADLLLAYEHFEDTFKHTIHIPESTLAGDDLLHEVKIELDFMFKMQRLDGSVYTKVATRFFPGMIMPEVDLEPLFVFDISSPATADFAAAMAMAARVYDKIDPTYGMKCLEAAEKAYQWLTLNPAPLLFKNPENINSGEYGDDSDTDERYWAAAELFRTTGKACYYEDFVKMLGQNKELFSLGWANVAGYGTMAYLLSIYENPNSPLDQVDLDKIEIANGLKEKWLEQAQKLEKRSHVDGYGITLELDEYIWGSTMILLNQTMHLIFSNRLLGTTQYDSIIHNNWDYLFGMNPVDLSYVTGLGECAIMAPHHRPSEGDGVVAPVPGLVSGGPCAGLYDDAVKMHCEGQPPAKCFIDDVGSYSTNEITIYWNSPAVYVGAYLSK